MDDVYTNSYCWFYNYLSIPPSSLPFMEKAQLYCQCYILVIQTEI